MAAGAISKFEMPSLSGRGGALTLEREGFGTQAGNEILARYGFSARLPPQEGAEHKPVAEGHDRNNAISSRAGIGVTWARQESNLQPDRYERQDKERVHCFCCIFVGN
jgi:hypothetical protein